MNPNPDLDQTLSLFDKLIHSGSWIPLTLLALFFGLRFASARYPWFKEGKRAAWTAAALNALAVLAGPAMQGQTPNAMQLMAAFTSTLTLLVPPIPPPQPAKQNGGFISLSLMLMIALAALLGALTFGSLGCSGAQRAAEKQALTCAEDAAFKDLTPTVKSILESGVSSWQQQLEALGVAFGKDALACAVIAAEEAFAAKTGAGSGSSSANPDAAARAKQFLTDHGYVVVGAVSAVTPEISRAAAWLATTRPGCESPREAPAVDCRPFRAMRYDGCRWTCEAM